MAVTCVSAGHRWREATEDLEDERRGEGGETPRRSGEGEEMEMI